MSFISSYKFGRKLRKLSVSGVAINPINRTEDSDQPGLALHTRPEVQNARLRLYVHHMLQGWPKWEGSVVQPKEKHQQPVESNKKTYWTLPSQIGYNIHSELKKQEISELASMGVKCVRIGAVGVGEKNYFELSGFRTEPKRQLEKLAKTVSMLQNLSIDVVITLKRSLASPEVWRMIAEKFVAFENVVGYDLLNEPFTTHEESLHLVDLLESTTVDPGK